LDARDPEGSRSELIDQIVAAGGKKIVYLINKVDLIPNDNLQEWVKFYKAEKLMCVPFSGNFQNSEDRKESQEAEVTEE